MNSTSKPKIVVPSLTERLERQREQDRIASRQYAVALRYDKRKRAFHFSLRSGAAVSIPVSEISEFAHATRAQLGDVRLVPTGEAIEQRELDIDLSVPGLLRDVFGFGELQQHRAGRARSTAKTVAARLNGTKGGRPRKNTQQ